MTDITDYIRGELLSETPNVISPSTFYGVSGYMPDTSIPVGYVELYPSWDTSNPTGGTVAMVDVQGEACYHDINGHMILAVADNDTVNSAAIGLLEYDIPLNSLDFIFRINTTGRGTLGTSNGFCLDFIHDVSTNVNMDGVNRLPTTRDMTLVFPSAPAGTLQVTSPYAVTLFTEHTKFTSFNGDKCIRANKIAVQNKTVWQIYEDNVLCYSFEMDGLTYNNTGCVAFRYFNVGSPSTSSIVVDGINITNVNIIPYSDYNLLTIHDANNHPIDRTKRVVAVDLSDAISWGATGVSTRSTVPLTIEMAVHEMGAQGFGVNKAIDFYTEGAFHDITFAREVISINNYAMPGSGFHFVLSKGKANRAVFNGPNNTPSSGLELLGIQFPTNNISTLNIINYMDGSTISPTPLGNITPYTATNRIRIRFVNTGGYCTVEIYRDAMLVYTAATSVPYITTGCFILHSHTINNALQRDFIHDIVVTGDIVSSIDTSNDIDGPTKTESSISNNEIILSPLGNYWPEDTANVTTDVYSAGWIEDIAFEFTASHTNDVNKLLTLYLSSGGSKRITSGLIPDNGNNITKVEMPFGTNDGYITLPSGNTYSIVSTGDVGDLNGVVKVKIATSGCHLYLDDIEIGATLPILEQVIHDVNSITFSSNSHLVIGELTIIADTGEKNQYLSLKASSKDGLELLTSIDIMLLLSKLENISANTLSIRQAATIQDRDTQSATYGIDLLVFVEDASGDPDVTSGRAGYFYRQSDQTFIRFFTEENMEGIVTEWAAISNTPISSVGQIDNSVALNHFHNNTNVLDGMGETNANLNYNNIELNDSWEIDNITW